MDVITSEEGHWAVSAGGGRDCRAVFVGGGMHRDGAFRVCCQEAEMFSDWAFNGGRCMSLCSLVVSLCDAQETGGWAVASVAFVFVGLGAIEVV